MTASGEVTADETMWADYGRCATCKTRTGAPCVNVATKAELKHPHPARQRRKRQPREGGSVGAKLDLLRIVLLGSDEPVKDPIEWIGVEYAASGSYARVAARINALYAAAGSPATTITHETVRRWRAGE